MKNFILAFISAFTLFSCSETEEISFPLQNITPTSIARGDKKTIYSNDAVATNFVINSIPDWNNFIANMIAPTNLLPTFSETEIDFNSFTVIAIFDKKRITVGDEIIISSIVESKENITVNVVYDNEGAEQIPTFPYYLVKIPKKTKPFIFK